jgi:hypothetical protein
MAFWVMWTLSSSVGKMLIAASVTMIARSRLGTSMMKAWLMRRSVRSPVPVRTTAPISSSVCRLPFISISALPSRASRTAIGGGVAVRGVHDLVAGDVELELRGYGFDLGASGRPGSVARCPVRPPPPRP